VLPATAWSAGFFRRFATRSGLESDGVAVLLRRRRRPARALSSFWSLDLGRFVRSSVVEGRVRPGM
jgi:hypothetical protein